MYNNNIFEGAEFGDRFLTRDGRVAVFSHTFFSKDDNEEFAILMIPIRIQTEYNEDETNSLLVSLDGTWHRKKYECNDDIVSRYQEPGGENKHDESVWEGAVKKAWNFIENNLLEYTGLDYATVEEAFYETMEG